MKKIVGTTAKVVTTTVEVCDGCEADGALPLRIHWEESCPHGGCDTDWGDGVFCSTGCAERWVQKTVDALLAVMAEHAVTVTVTLSFAETPCADGPPIDRSALTGLRTWLRRP